LIYNNIFNNSATNALHPLISGGTGNVWNITKTPGMNIVGNPYLGGNFWHDYTGVDTNNDGFGDTNLPYTSNNNIQTGGDYLPLNRSHVTDIIPPRLTIISPVEGRSYLANYINLNVTSPDPDVAFWWYNLNRTANVTFTPNITISNLAIGNNNITVYVNDTSQNTNWSMVNFTIAQDVLPPVLYVVSPVNSAEYASHSVPLQVVSMDPDAFSWWYSINGGTNTTFIPNITLNLANGLYNLKVYVDDIAGNVNSSTLAFQVNVTGPDPTAPVLYVISPANNAEYTSHFVPLQVASPDPDVFHWWYNLNGGLNITFVPNTTMSLANGSYSLQVYVDDFAGNANSSTISFRVNVTSSAIPRGGGAPYVPPTPVPTVTPNPPQFAITVRSPEKGSHSQREYPLRYESSVPLARVFYSVDRGQLVPIAGFSPIDISRLTLGNHDVTVYGIDYDGRYGQGSVNFRVVPLTFGEIPQGGTPGYPDEIAYSFTGRDTEYTLVFEARDVTADELEVDLNSNLAGRMGIDPVIVPFSGSGEKVPTSGLAAGDWKAFSYDIPSANITPGSENIITFIHTGNPQKQTGLESWQIRNATLKPKSSFLFPKIDVSTENVVVSPKGEVHILLKIDGITNPDEYNAYVSIVTPDGRALYYPTWGENPEPLPAAFVTNNYFGKLPVAIALQPGDPAGTYIISGKMTEKGETKPVSLATAIFFFDEQTALKLYSNRPVYTDGHDVIISEALTGGAFPVNGTVVMSLVNPSGLRIYSETKHYAPVMNNFSVRFGEAVTSYWNAGVYVADSSLYAESGELLATDKQVFEVCHEPTTVILRPVVYENSGRIMTQGPEFSRRSVQIRDARSLDIVLEDQGTGSPFSYSIPLRLGSYFLTGYFTDAGGNVYPVGATPLSVSCGETKEVVLPLYNLTAPMGGGQG
jgi:hypothetical protein